jgi:UDP-N-acetylmuramoyl-L-alanyl-D-glutamate--2,6-diaminopimelate ligase
VDYAHTPDGLEQVLVAARDLRPGGEVTVVFGCGGDRDASKRPAMGEVAAGHADRVILTADNSRGEDTGAIIEAVQQGYLRAPARPGHDLAIEPDRRSAIARALRAARPGDVVVVAGKGHEGTQTIGDVTVPFDDRVVVREELARLGSDRR